MCHPILRTVLLEVLLVVKDKLWGGLQTLYHRHSLKLSRFFFKIPSHASLILTSSFELFLFPILFFQISLEILRDNF